MFRRLTILTIALASASALIACSNSTNPSATVTAVAITGVAPVKGQSVQFSAIATMSDGTTKDVTSLSTWSTSDQTIASVTAAGVVTGIADGGATITAVYLNDTSTDPIQITG